MPAPVSEAIIAKKALGPYDVLLGRGTGPNEHIGNIRFRSRVRELIEQVGVNELVNGGLTKSHLAKQVVNHVAEKGGVFVKKAASSPVLGGHESNGGYIEVSRTVAFDKTKQSFRHQLRCMAAKTEYQEKHERKLAQKSMKKRASNHGKKFSAYYPKMYVQEPSNTTPYMMMPSSASRLPSAEALLQLHNARAPRYPFSFGTTFLLPSSIAPLSGIAGGTNLVEACLGSALMPRSTASQAVEAVIIHERQKRAALLSILGAAIDVDHVHLENGSRRAFSPGGPRNGESSTYF